MGRKPDPKVEEKRKEARRHAQDGLTGPQIAAKMGTTTQRVYGWLRGAGKPSHRAEVVKRLKKGMLVRQIAAEVGCAEETVRHYERQMRDELEIQVVDTKDPNEWVNDWAKNPTLRTSERYTRYDSFGGALISRLNRETNANPELAKSLIDLAIGLFERKRSRARKVEHVRTLTCNLVQATAISAARERALDRPRPALEILRKAEHASAGCQACQADLSRRRALVLRDLKHYPEAFAQLDLSQDHYKRLGNDGHDGFFNGLGACALALVGTHYYNGSAGVASKIAEEALCGLSPDGRGLHFGLSFWQGLALAELSALKEAKSLAEDLLKRCGTKSDFIRLRTVWFAGRIAELEGDLDVAHSYYEDAYDCALDLGFPPAIAAVLADLESLSPDPSSIKRRIRRLSTNREKAVFPDNLESLRGPLAFAYRATSATGVKAALSRLRQTTGGNKTLPRSASAAAV